MAGGAPGERPVGLPRLMVIADRFTGQAVFGKVLQLADAKVLPWVQLRDHEASSEAFESATRRIVNRLRAMDPGTRISLNGHPELAASLGVGVHLGFRNVRPALVPFNRTAHACLGYSAHIDEDIAVIAKCDYITISPIFPVPAKPASVPIGLDGLAYTAKSWDGPVYALGGLHPDNVRSCLDAGAYGISVLSGILGVDDPVDAAQRYLARINEWDASND